MTIDEMKIHEETYMALLRYYGSKNLQVKHITSHFPPHETFVDLFGGSGAILLGKQPSPVEVYNDLDLGVWNFMTTLRDCRDELIEAIMLTPYSRYEIDRCRFPADQKKARAMIDSIGRVEMARRFYVLSWQGRSTASASHRSNRGWRFVRSADTSSYPPNDFYNVDDILYASRRFQNVQIECDSAQCTIERYDTPQTFFYADPPYSAQASERREVDRGYAIEMPEWQHRELIEQLRSIRGSAIISGYMSPLYRELLDDWRIVQREFVDDRNNKKVECLWLSPSATMQSRMF